MSLRYGLLYDAPALPVRSVLCALCRLSGATTTMNPIKRLLQSFLRRLPRPAVPGAAGLPPFDRAKAGLMLVTIAALSLMMSVHLRQDRIALHLNDTSTREVRAARSVVYVDTETTARLQQGASQLVRPVYTVDDHAAVSAHRSDEEIFDGIANARGAFAPRTPPRPGMVDQAIAALQSPTGLSRANLRRLLTVPPAVFQKLRDTSLRLVDDAMDREIRDTSDDAKRTQQDVLRRAQEALPAGGDAELVQAITQQAIRPNHLFDRARTRLAQQAASRAVPPTYARLFPGDKIIGPGEIVHQDTLDKLTALGLLDPRQEVTTGVAICVLAGVMVMLVAYYIARMLPALYADTRRLALLSVIVLFSVAGLKVGATLLGLQFSGWQLGYLGMMSVAAAGMLVSVLLDVHLAMLIVALLSIQSGIIMNHEIRFSVMTLLSSLVGIASVAHVRRKTNLLQTTAALALCNVGLVWLLGLLFNDRVRELLTGSAWGAGVAPFATFLFWFGVLALEKPFGILTHTTLLEMSAFDRPLLQRLCAVAPGTYAHSIMVGTLAEAGAQAVGAEALLCRVAGYYHDIGKMNRPDFFIENQRADNVHGRLSPSLSALIITAHVRDGVEMAKQERLPDEIRDIIAQHHGTTLISYFYRQALADNGCGECVPPGMEERFRYPGPKPQTRESAIVMLADSVEAAARCVDKPNQEKLEALIGGIVRGKIEDGQLDQCPLTFADVKTISDAFLHVLRAMMHGRIDYPKDAPRTATGKPMEVSRADLRPEAPALQIPGGAGSVPVENVLSLSDDRGISQATGETILRGEPFSPAAFSPMAFCPTPFEAVLSSEAGVMLGAASQRDMGEASSQERDGDLRGLDAGGFDSANSDQARPGAQAYGLPPRNADTLEVSLERQFTQRSDAARPNGDAEAGRAPSAANPKSRARRGKRSADR